MKIAVASDHRGVEVKSRVLSLLNELGQDALDYGPENSESVDYPDFAAKVASVVSEGKIDRGILICGTGIGMCITANKFGSVRAANCTDALSAEMSRRHNDANVLCLSADLLAEPVIANIVKIWIKAKFEGGRHSRRVDKISEIEKETHSEEN